MKKALLFLLLIAGPTVMKGQNMGLSFSYFFPKNGYFSVPVTPLSLRGVGFDITNFLAIESGFTLYRISGMGVKGLPWESKKPLIGPMFSIMVPLEVVITMDFGGSALKLKGGGFGFYNFASKINEGNLDREMRTYLGWEVINTDFTIQNRFGYGYHFGAEFIIYFSKKFGISLEAYYLSGEAPLEMQGSYTGIPSNGDLLVNEQVDYRDAVLDFTGYELSLGLLFTP